MTWIQTYSGLQFWPLNPKPEDVRLEDIAHALSLSCRFNGHCRKFYSVAQHSVLVARHLLTHGVLHSAGIERRTMAFRAALLHDAAEAYLPDVSRPIKPTWEDFERIEEHLLRCIHVALDVRIDSETEMTIKHCDNALLATEARDLLGSPPAPWEDLPMPVAAIIAPWRPETAERIWLQEWTK
ncbi:hypothetical protein LCGC14_2218530 [marine sediment metagenome]|uniref:HD/PDEase domain-containing protein n=1 Tax=marine sediment metagenome TaxID=412755 RepID=A0A0F9DBN2_9ZZZZ